MVTKFIDFLRRRLFAHREKAAIRQAQRLADLHRCKYLVMLWKGRPEVVSMQGIKSLIRQKKLNLTADKARQIAIYEAIPKHRTLCS